MLNMLLSTAGQGKKKLYSDDVFSTTTYTGNGADRNITNGIDLAGRGGLVWTKVRNTSRNHGLIDTVRGAWRSLSTNTITSTSVTGGTLTGFSSLGYSLGVDSTKMFNDASSQYVSWTFRRAQKFFDVVLYTGDGLPGRQIEHSLGVPPGMITVKAMLTSAHWPVYHRELGNQQYLLFNTTDAAYPAATFWGAEPSASTFTVTDHISVNQSGMQYIAYLWAHDDTADGIIQCGSNDYQVELGWRPQYVLFKPNTVSADWYVYDVARGTTNFLRPNTANVELVVNGVPFVATSTGFVVFEDFFAGNSFIYMAIREPNKPV